MALNHPADIEHPPRRRCLYCHVGWVFSRRHDETDFRKIADFARYPELMWLHRFKLLPPIASLLSAFYLLDGSD